MNKEKIEEKKAELEKAIEIMQQLEDGASVANFSRY